MGSEMNECMEMLNKIRLLGKKYMKCDELATAEFFVLVQIEETSKEHETYGVTGSELAELMEQTLSSVSKMIKNLEEKGYVTRNPSSKDRRVSYIAVTDKGRRKIAGVRNRHEKILRYTREKMGDKDMAEFCRLLKQWYTIIKMGMEETWND